MRSEYERIVKKAVILIGSPGSGKSFKAHEIADNYPPWDVSIHSTDSFFMKDGVYDYQPNLLGVWHRKNLEFFKISLDKGLSMVICDNTNLQSRDRKPYILAAIAAGYEVEFITVGEFTEEALNSYADRNTHSVSLEVIMKMAKHYQPISDREMRLKDLNSSANTST